MKKIFVYFSQWGKDKILHFALSLIISIVAAFIRKACGGDKFMVLAVAWLAGFAAGIGKELYDEWKYKGADEKDWAADVLGTTLGTILSFLLVA
jgi:VanZ family protein